MFQNVDRGGQRTHTALFILHWLSSEADVFTHLLCTANEHHRKYAVNGGMNRQLMYIGAAHAGIPALTFIVAHLINIG